MRRRRNANLGFSSACNGLKPFEHLNKMVVPPAEGLGNPQADVAARLIFLGLILIAEEIAVIRNIAADALQAPDKIQMPHGFGVFAVCNNFKAVLNLTVHHVFGCFKLAFLIPFKIRIKRVGDVVALFNLMFVVQQFLGAQQTADCLKSLAHWEALLIFDEAIITHNKTYMVTLLSYIAL